MLIMFISLNICLLKMYMTGSMFIKFGKCTKSVPLPNCDETHHLLTCYASPQVKRIVAIHSDSSENEDDDEEMSKWRDRIIATFKTCWAP